MPKTIETMHELQRLVPVIVKALNADQDLARRALANPLLALEELGYELTDELRLAAEWRVRFNASKAAKLEELAAEVHKLARERFDIDSPAELSRVLFDKLKLPLPPAEPGAPPWEGVARPFLDMSRSIHGRHVHDPLEPLREKHPVLVPLLKYRQIEASEPRLASRELYERIRRGEAGTPVKHVRIRLQRGPTPQ